jgi:hypothetical protein
LLPCRTRRKLAGCRWRSAAQNPIARGRVSGDRRFEERRLRMSAMQSHNGRGGQDCAARK